MGDLKLFSYRAAFSNVLNFASEPKKPEQDLKGMKSADATNTSGKASDQGKGWGSWCSLQYPTHLLCLEVLRWSVLTLVTQTALPPQSNLLSTAPFPWNQTATVLEELLLIQRRGHPQSLISSCALDEFRFCELENLALWFLAISYAGHMPCTPFEDPVKEMGALAQEHWEQLPLQSPPLVLQDPQETQPTRTKATACLCSYCAASSALLLILSASSFLDPHRLGYKAGKCACSLLQQHRITGEDSLCPLFSFFQHSFMEQCTVQPKKSHSCWFFSAELFCFSSEPSFSIIPLKLSEIWVFHCLALGDN